jgi:mono/diheme cytochrome c family protein
MLERCEATPASTEVIERGRTLFAQQACASCHAGNGPAPRLRLGLPLLGRAYFRARVLQGTGDRASPVWLRRWDATDGTLIAHAATPVTMPAHANLDDSDLDALYTYVSADRSDVPTSLPVAQSARIAVPDEIRSSLYHEVQHRVFDTSCRHCHSPNARDQSLIASVFGAVPDAAPVELPMTRLAVVPEPTLKAILSAGPGCSDSPLLARLKARGEEWAGRAKSGAPRGMPLTMPPLDGDAIRLVAVWTQVGCPSDHGDLCTPCAPSGK